MTPKLIIIGVRSNAISWEYLISGLVTPLYRLRSKVLMHRDSAASSAHLQFALVLLMKAFTSGSCIHGTEFIFEQETSWQIITLLSSLVCLVLLLTYTNHIITSRSGNAWLFILRCFSGMYVIQYRIPGWYKNDNSEIMWNEAVIVYFKLLT